MENTYIKNVVLLGYYNGVAAKLQTTAQIAGFIKVQQCLASLFIDNVKSNHLFVVRQKNDSNDA